MSSFIGIWGKNDSLKSSIQDLIPEPDFYLNNNSVCIWLDGYHLTNHVHYNETTQTGWVVSGIGISSGEEPKTLIKEDWEYLLHSNSDLHSSINGHFAIARWSTGTLELTTDQVGMRNIFMHQTGEYILFSTRLDWIIKLVPQVSIDWKLFGSTWLGINPFSSHCFINRIDRLAQGGKAIITSDKVLFSNKRWTPSSIQSTSESVEQTLASLCLAAHRSFGTLSLGLSGGLDSRVLYALLIDSGIEPLSVYTFLEHGHPDEKMAARLSEMYDLKHHSLPIQPPPVDEIKNQTSEISTRSLLMASIFQLPAFNGYTSIGNKNRITLDGAFGEIGRRRYLRGLELRGKKYLLDRNIPGLIPFFYAPKADIFLPEIETEMQAGFRQEFEEEVFHMPIPDKKNTGNWLDLFSIRTRGQNLYGLTNGLNDGILFHYMPFIQPDFLNALLGLSEKQRSDARLFRRIISKSAPKLETIPLVKGDEVYPYWMTDIPAMLWMKISQKLGNHFKNNAPTSMLLPMEEMIMDWISSNSMVDYDILDETKVNDICSDFYRNKNYNRANEVGWLFTFLTFQTQLN